MSASFVNLLPMIFVALGAMVSIAMEPFVADKNKQKVLPWVASAFLVLSAISFVFGRAPRGPFPCRVALRIPWNRRLAGNACT